MQPPGESCTATVPPCASTMPRTTASPVSYTHLDVYKRQLIGWSAVTNTVAWPAWILFLVIFFWTPPHYWPLSMKFKDDYAAAAVPMLPVVARFVTVSRQILIYSWVCLLYTSRCV